MNIPGPIIILDDDADDHAIIRMICTNIGVCSSITSFFEAQHLIDFLKTSKEDPFMILCDINMPMVNGFQLREELWKDVALRRKTTPFIFFSTSASKALVERAFELSVQGFFLKGNNLQQMEKRLKIIFEYWMESKTPNSF
jgi:DNA-binding NarL/FixJ family response regulator